ncbi:MAG: TonB-dependent receptor plug domain-containing protein [Thermoguttaceae bacterium]
MNDARQARPRVGFLVFPFLGATCIFVAAAGAADSPNPTPGDPVAAAAGNGGGSATNALLNMDLDQLSRADVKVPSMDVSVTSVTREASTIGHSAAAIFVITPEMIRRSGARNIPEALRLAPGLDVAQINGNEWAISSRGFNSGFANKLLVLIDGRTVYTPAYAGVLWAVQNVMLEDVERIEVIRGPGATVWGANAVNGVINIITKSAKDTHGVLATGGGGTFERGFGSLRVGGQTDTGVSYRAYGMYSDQGPTWAPYGAYDATQLGQGGFRLDWDAGRDPQAGAPADRITFQGDYYNGTAQDAVVEPVFPDPTFQFERMVKTTLPLEGGNLLTRWTHTVDQDSDYSLQFYYDRLSYSIPVEALGQDTFDLDFTDRFALTDRQKIVWGGGYRFTGETFQNSSYTAIEPSTIRLNLFSAFLQDEIAIVPDKLSFTAGCKLEHNDFTGFECQPSLRLLWILDKKSSAWGAISRAVRTPDVFEYYGHSIGVPVEPGLPIFPLTIPNPNIISETLLAYELGYRVQATDRISWDLALFYNHYDSLVTYSAGPIIPPGFIPSQGNNEGAGDTYGFEWSYQWQISNRWKLRGYYAFLEMQLHAAPGAIMEGAGQAGSSPQNQISLMSSWDLGSNVEFDMMARYVDALVVSQVPEYIDMDLRLAWRPRKHLELEVVGQNLLSNHVLQFNDQAPSIDLPTEIPRGVYGKVTWTY